MSFTLDWYRLQAPGSSRSAAKILPLVLDILDPSSAVDVGCGVGTWLKGLMNCGLTDVIGVDGDYVDRDQLLIPVKHFVAADLTKPLRLGRRFDLAVSLEVAEHLPESAACQLVETLVSLSPAVLFSAAVPGQMGNGHLNEQWPAYWAERFARFDFVPIDFVRRRIWTDPDVEPWYAQNTILYVNASMLESNSRVRQLQQWYGGPVLSLVHPERYSMYVDLYHRERSRPFGEIAIRRLREVIPRPIKTGIRTSRNLVVRLVK